ncbi:MAG: hypothetical protein ACRCWG_15405 [Sarcina sp.]
MGNYLYLGIRNKASADIQKLKRYDGAVDVFLLELNKSFDKSIYNIEVNDERIDITLKEEFNTGEVIRDFLLEEFAKLDPDDEWLQAKVEKLKVAITKDEVIEALEADKDVTRCYVQLSDVPFRPEAMYQVETIAFLSAGKFYLEQYGDLSKYIIKTLRNSSDNPLIKSLGFYEY